MCSDEPVSDDFPELVSTGTLPRLELVERLMQEAHDRYAGVDEGLSPTTSRRWPTPTPRCSA